MINTNAWRGFNPGEWQTEINVRDFIQRNYTPYEDDERFLAGPTDKTKRLMDKLSELAKLERERGGVLDIDTETVSSLTTYPPAYLDREDEIIVGLQTGKLHRANAGNLTGIPGKAVFYSTLFTVISSIIAA